MSMTELKILFPAEKLDALRFFMDKKQQTVEQELKDYLDKSYERLVPAQVREYLESRIEQASVQQQAAEAQQEQEPEPAVVRERPARSARRQREQTATEVPPTVEAQSEAEGPAEEETPGMTMSM